MKATSAISLYPGMKTRLLLVLFAGSLVLTGCETFRKCTGTACAGDAALPENVTVRFAHYPMWMASRGPSIPSVLTTFPVEPVCYHSVTANRLTS